MAACRTRRDPACPGHAGAFAQLVAAEKLSESSVATAVELMCLACGQEFQREHETSDD